MKIQKHSLNHYNERAQGAEVTTLVIHSMWTPDSPGHELDTGRCIRVLDSFEVSAHYLIGVAGEVCQLVEEENRAWHAGESALPQSIGAQAGVNDFSIGIELVGEEHKSFSDAQYLALVELTLEILDRHNIRFVLGHEHVALPLGRKTDPGPLFDWERFKRELEQRARRSLNLKFPFDI